MSRRRVVVLLLTTGSWCCEPLFPQDATAALEAAARQFLPNAGQWQPEVLFAARGDTALAAVTATGVELRLARPADQPMLPLVLRWSRPCGEVVGEQAAGGAFAVFQGRDRSRWRSGLTGFGMVRCRAIAAGVDLRLRQAAAGFEYDLLLAPGADLTQVKLQVDGGLGMALEADGRLRIDTAAGPLYQGIPATWAELPDGSRQPVNCRFAVCAADRFGFELEDRPAGRPIVIDPVPMPVSNAAMMLPNAAPRRAGST